ncbi:MAG: methyltransferase, partial [Pseudoalteromonas sp.]
MTLAEQFFALDSLLMSHRQYWQCTAFDFDTIPWPELQGILNELTDDQVTVLDNDQNQLYQFFSQHINQLDELAKLCELPSSA